MLSSSDPNRIPTTERIAWRPSVAPGIRCQDTDDGVILLDKENKQVHQLNQVGAAVLHYCDGSNTSVDIVKLLLQEFAVGRARLSGDIADLLQKLHALGILK